jgi:transcriptional regulator with XRE-family HTH domain
MDLSIRIAAWRKAKGLSQAALAIAAGVTVSSVSHWETGDWAPSQAHLAAIIDRMGLSMARFYGRVPRSRAAA